MDKMIGIEIEAIERELLYARNARRVQELNDRLLALIEEDNMDADILAQDGEYTLLRYHTGDVRIIDKANNAVSAWLTSSQAGQIIEGELSLEAAFRRFRLI